MTNQELEIRLNELEIAVADPWCSAETAIEYADLMKQKMLRDKPALVSTPKPRTQQDMLLDELAKVLGEEIGLIEKRIREDMRNMYADVNQKLAEENAFIRHELASLRDDLVPMPRKIQEWKKQRRVRTTNAVQ